MSVQLGRGSATTIAALLGWCIAVVLHFGPAEAAVFTVGGSTGWTFNVANWTDGKIFHAGDQLVFNYPPDLHNVKIVDVNVFDGCFTKGNPKPYPTFTSGKDTIKLIKGFNYFACGVPGHCELGMRIAVNAQ